MRKIVSRRRGAFRRPHELDLLLSVEARRRLVEQRISRVGPLAARCDLQSALQA